MTLERGAAHVPGGRTQELKTIVRGAGISFVGSISSLLLGIGFQWLLARLLGPTKVGIISLALSIFGLAALLAEFGLEQGAIRFVALYMDRGDRGRAAGVIIAGVRIIGILSLAVAVILFGAADPLAEQVFGKPPLAPVLRVLAISLPFATVSSFLMFVMRGLKRVEYEAAINQVIVPLLKIGGLIVVVYTVGYSVVGVAWALLLVSIVGAALAIISMWQLYPLRGQSERPVLVTRAMLAFSWPLLLIGIVNKALQEAETLFLGVWVASDQVGIYYTCLRATVLITAFLIAFSTIFAPIMAGLHGRQEHGLFGSLLKTVTKWGFSLSIPVFLVLFVFSDQVLLVFGPGFVEGAPILQILAVSQLVNVATGPVGWALTMSGHPRLELLNSLFFLAVNIALALVLIPRYGIMGAAFSGAVVVVLINLLRLVEVYVVLHVHPYNLSYLKPVAAGILSLLVLVGLRPLVSDLSAFGQAGISAFVALSTYVVGLLVFRLDADDRMVLDAIGRRLGRLVSSRTGEDRIE